MTSEAYVQFHSREARERILKRIRDKDLAKQLNTRIGLNLRIDRMRTDVHRSRDWAMRKSRAIYTLLILTQSQILTKIAMIIS